MLCKHSKLHPKPTMRSVMTRVAKLRSLMTQNVEEDVDQRKHVPYSWKGETI
jgi:hypothetical protein